jgi:hypothetical protein
MEEREAFRIGVYFPLRYFHAPSLSEGAHFRCDALEEALRRISARFKDVIYFLCCSERRPYTAKEHIENEM